MPSTGSQSRTRKPPKSMSFLTTLAAAMLAGMSWYVVQTALHFLALHWNLVIDPEFAPRQLPARFAAHAGLGLLTAPLLWIAMLPLARADDSWLNRLRRGWALASLPWLMVGGLALFHGRVLQDTPPTSLVALLGSVGILLVSLSLCLPLTRREIGRGGWAAASVWLLVGLALAGMGLRSVRGGAPERRVAGEGRPDVLLISVDTLRKDRLGCYGAKLGATPAMDALAASGMICANATSQAPVTLPAHASIMTGTPPATHGVRYNGSHRLGRELPTLAEIFKEAGYATSAFISAAPLEARYGLDRGFDLYEDRLPPTESGSALIAARRSAMTHVLLLRLFFERFFGKSTPPTEIRGEETVNQALDWLLATPNPRFCWVHVFEPHSPYEPAPEMIGRYPANPEEQARIDNLLERGKLRGQRFEILTDPVDLGLYNAEVATVDRALSRLIDQWRAESPDAIIMLLADHGEHLGDHGYWGHTAFLYEPALAIPLMVAAPGRIPPGTVVSEAIQQTDVMPTLCELAGLISSPWARGRSFAPPPGSQPPSTTLSEHVPAERPMLLETKTTDGGRLVAAKWGPWKLVRTWPETSRGLAEATGLFNLADDPAETTDLASREPEWAARVDSVLNELMAVYDGAAKAQALNLDEATRKRLEALGYVQ